jgi:hypothetical protein
MNQFWMNSVLFPSIKYIPKLKRRQGQMDLGQGLVV